MVLPHLIQKNESIALDQVLSFIDSRKNWLDGVVVTGGELTIHKDLPHFSQ